jgi:hypothetical protein
MVRDFMLKKIHRKPPLHSREVVNAFEYINYGAFRSTESAGNFRLVMHFVAGQRT